MDDHCVIDLCSQPPLFRCMICDAQQALQLPIPLHEAAWLADQWVERHAACAEPKEDHPSLTAEERNPTLR